FEQLSRDVPSSTVEIRTTMNELLEQIKHLSIDVNTLAHDLHSPKLEYLGIAKTMRGFCKDFGQKRKVEIDFKTRDLQGPVPLDLSLSLFRVLQEALRNSAQHSGTRKFEVELFE